MVNDTYEKVTAKNYNDLVENAYKFEIKIEESDMNKDG